MSSDRKLEKIEQNSSSLFTLPGFNNEIPVFKLTQQSKERFMRGLPGQGYAMVIWRGEDGIAYISLVPAFNGGAFRKNHPTVTCTE